MTDLTKKACQACEGIGKKYTQSEITAHMKMIDKAWHHDKSQQHIRRHFHFKNHFEVMAFVNAVAWISHRDDHHPSIVVNYADCEITYSTHALGGLTENDFICASKVDALT